MDNKEEVLDAIRKYVRGGEHSAGDVESFVGEELFDGELDEGWLHAQVRKAFAAHRKEQKSWPAVTDCDRLDRAFAALNGHGILALHRASYTQQDGLDVVDERWREMGGKKSPVIGYCFYTWQDWEGVIEGGTLFLAFGDIGRKAARGVAVGERIKAALEAEGLTVEWDGSIKTRLQVVGMKWQRRG